MMRSQNAYRYQTTIICLCLAICWLLAAEARGQTPPQSWEIKSYRGLFKAVIDNDTAGLKQAIAITDDIDSRDEHQRTALHVAAHFANHDAMQLLVKAGANPNALEGDRYDMVTIAAVANDLGTMKLALKLGNKANNVTSRYDGTALIAAAHLGHVEIVKALIKAGAPLDHINNLQWTALIESIVLGDGGQNHILTLKNLVEAGADLNIPNGQGNSPLTLAKQHGYTEMVEILAAAGAK